MNIPNKLDLRTSSPTPSPSLRLGSQCCLGIFRKETNATWILKYFSGHSFRAAVGCQQNITFGQNLHFSIFLWTLLDLFIFTRVHWILKFRLPHCMWHDWKVPSYLVIIKCVNVKFHLLLETFEMISFNIHLSSLFIISSSQLIKTELEFKLNLWRVQQPQPAPTPSSS